MTIVRKLDKISENKHLDDDIKSEILDAGYEIMMGRPHEASGILIRIRNRIENKTVSKEVMERYKSVCNRYTERYGELKN